MIQVVESSRCEEKLGVGPVDDLVFRTDTYMWWVAP